MKKEKLEKIKRRFKTSSWALWSDDFPDGKCLEENPSQIFQMVLNRIEELNLNVVLLAKNPSGKIPLSKWEGFVNFHSCKGKNRDSKLKEIIQDGKLKNIQGAYMTDLSEKVATTLKEFEPNIIKKLEEELNILGEKNYKIICFGNDVFNTLRKKMKLKDIIIGKNIKKMECELNISDRRVQVEIYKVWHFSPRNKYPIEELETQLKYLNDLFKK